MRVNRNLAPRVQMRACYFEPMWRRTMRSSALSCGVAFVRVPVPVPVPHAWQEYYTAVSQHQQAKGHVVDDAATHHPHPLRTHTHAVHQVQS